MLIYNIFVYLLGTIFTIVPTTQYVWINQTATFTCATNDAGYNILSFNIPAGIDDDTTVTDLPGGGQLATTSFTVTSDNNGTSVRCLAHNGDLTSTTPVYAYAQGTVDHRIMVLTYCLPRSPIVSSRSYSSTTRVWYIH